MPVPTPVELESNIWVAAGDGDIAQVGELVERHSVSPNAPDSFSYTPMHAAASYGHLNILEYLISHGGDVNVSDSDGDTPLYAVESLEVARFLVDRGAEVGRRNSEGLTAAEHLLEEFPEISSYLQTVSARADSDDGHPVTGATSQVRQEAASEQLATSLLASAEAIIRRAEADGHDPDAELRAVVGQTVLAGMMTGYAMSGESEAVEGSDN